MSEFSTVGADSAQSERPPCPLLTLAIPTYNRSGCLRRLLEMLAPQLAGRNCVELLISDNASTDDTSAILDSFCRRGLKFRLIRNDTNIGPDGNFEQCFTQAAGKYVWIFGDDDVIVPGGLSIILNVLADGDYDLVHLRGRRYEEGSTRAPLGRQPRIEIIRDSETFALRTHVFLTFITANIINKQRVLSVSHRPFAELNGSNLAQLGWTYTALRNLRQGVLILDHLILAGDDDRGGYLLFRVFGPQLKAVTETWLAKPELVRIVMNGAVQVFFPDYVLRSKLRAHEFDGERPDHLLESAFASNYRYYIFVYPLLKLPGWLGRGWKFLCRVINRMDKAAGNPLLR
jgi:abequosyltransferase